MKKQLGNAIRVGACLGLMLAINACSSSQKSGEDGAASGDALPEADAGTDAIPMGDLEQIEGNLDSAAAPKTADASKTDPAATPPGDSTGKVEVPSLTDPAAATTADATPPATTTPTDASTPPSTTAAADTAVAPAPANDPAPTASDSSSSIATSAGGSDTYAVQAGDTLMKIAFETYGDLYQWRKIYEMNKDKIQDPNHVPPGVTLTLDHPGSPVAIDRNGDKYMIKTGDTLGTISNDIYGTTSKWRKLWENNKQLIKDPNRIFAGFYLYYTLTPEERQQRDQQEPQTAPKPLADAPPADGGARLPATVTTGG